MIYELRSYKVKLGKLGDYLAFFEVKGFPILSRYAEAVGFWYSGPTETGELSQVNHIWGYESLEARFRQRTALYHDPAWIGGLVPVAMKLFLQLQAQLMVLQPDSEATLRRAMDTPRGGDGVVATFLPGRLPTGYRPSIGHWEMATGTLGGGFALDYLADTQLESPNSFAGAERQLWRPARFSRIQ